MKKQEDGTKPSTTYRHTTELCAALVLHAYYDPTMVSDELAAYFEINPRRVQPWVSKGTSWGLLRYTKLKHTKQNPTGARMVECSDEIKNSLSQFPDDPEKKFIWLCRLVEACRAEDIRVERQNRYGSV